MTENLTFRRFSISVTWTWLLIFALVPCFLMFATSLLTPGDDEFVHLQLTLSNYGSLFNIHTLRIFWRSIVLAGICTWVCLGVSYPFSYMVARSPQRFKHILLLLVMIPFWTSSLIRSYAMVAILKTNGILNTALLWLGVIQSPIQILYTNTATLIGLVYTLLPLMILPLYSSIEKLDYRLIDAARDLGARKHQIVLKVLIPLTMPGIIGGCVLVFLPATTLFYIPDLLGGAKTVLLGNLIQNQFLGARDWPRGAAISIFLTALMGIILFFYWRRYRNEPDQLYAPY